MAASAYIIRKKCPGLKVKRWEYARDEAKEIVSDLRKSYPQCSISMKPKRKGRGRTIKVRSNASETN